MLKGNALIKYHVRFKSNSSNLCSVSICADGYWEFCVRENK